MKKYFHCLLLLILPIIMVFTSLYLNIGPHWVVYNYDPEYQYLLNSLNLAHMKPVGLVEHPGTTVQSMGALILRTVHLLRFSSQADLKTDVLTNPEFYLAKIIRVFLGLNTVMLLILGLVTFWLTKSILSSLLVQTAPFFPHILEGFLFCLMTIRPESFLLLSSLLFLITLILFINKDTEKINHYFSHSRYLGKLSPDWVFTICFSIVSGFGMATKVTFIPLLVIPLIILPRYRYRITYVLGTALCFIFFTLPIIKEYDVVFSWFFSVFTHFGVHGLGPKKIIEPLEYLSNMKFILFYNGFLSIILFCSLCILVIGSIVPRFRKVSAQSVVFRILFAVSISQLLGIIIVAKHYRGFPDNYYLIPVLTLSGIMLLLIINYLGQLGLDFGIKGTGTLRKDKTGIVIFRIKSTWVVALIIMTCLFNSRKSEIIGFYQWKLRLAEHIFKITHKVENDYKDYARIYYLGSSAPAIALAYGDSSARRYYSRFLQKLYPNVYFYDYFTGKFLYWSQEEDHVLNQVPNPLTTNEVSFEEIVSKYGHKIIFQGPTFEDLFAMFRGSWRSLSHTKPDVPLRDTIEEKRVDPAHETILELDY
ncbi:hypothetical protein ACFL27_00045 [candidate division CSSED10-310 bacterium]|uniref:Glycosyltransferase RgtA/B/C/D-like domain-containing protein n=1 Tax=candidate division CSSED10-310 bacterium TaxID=2855610 RepID=A0ABV6YQV7_UNCC1